MVAQRLKSDDAQSKCGNGWPLIHELNLCYNTNWRVKVLSPEDIN